MMEQLQQRFMSLPRDPVNVRRTTCPLKSINMSLDLPLLIESEAHAQSPIVRRAREVVRLSKLALCPLHCTNLLTYLLITTEY